ncbi:Fic/DOC family N-terminal domain-containing protein [Helicobacter cinaedi]|uniref:Fic/DOC family N-terminal domain-containing protein n=1 Tax=Helicobacter cinaedi TaxID=213 RepID=UPI000D7C9652
MPSKINQEFVWDDSLINVLLEKATIKLGELNAFTLIVPSVDIFIQMHIRKEANYYDSLTRVRTHNDLVGWVKFFLRLL